MPVLVADLMVGPRTTEMIAGPARVAAYELTMRARGREPALEQLARWRLELLPPEPGDRTASAACLALSHRPPAHGSSLRLAKRTRLAAGEILAPIASDDDSRRLRAVYGIDWAAVEPRRLGLATAAELMAPDVEARMSPEVADRVLRGVSGFAVFVEGLEEDFSEFRYDADDVEDLGSGRYVVTGVIRARGRRSKMPLSAAFRHEWTFRDGVAQRVEASVGGPKID